LVGKPEGKRRRPRCRWEDNVEMDLQQIECDCVDCIDRVEDKGKLQTVVNAVMNFRFS
jgi:hypothetical protein